jgi:thiol-disulfide isomerase/thioredoxin
MNEQRSSRPLCSLIALILLSIMLGSAAIMPSVRALADAPSTLLGFDGNTGWINSPPLSPASLHGKVVLVDFWEYTCINCLRTLPYLREWYKKYQADGFVIVGVHTNEFGFSGDNKNISDAVKRLGITWPVVADTNNVVWNRYKSQAWPSEYLYDQNGQLVSASRGEGGYQETEAKIQALLKKANPSLHLPGLMALLPQDNYTKPGAVCYPATPETFVGPWRGNMIANAPAFANQSSDTNYDDRGSHDPGKVYLKGYWHPSSDGQAMVSGGSDGYLALNYQAIQVMIVMKPDSGKTVRVMVTQDGKPVAKKDAGADVQFDASGNSYIDVDTPRAYDVIDNAMFNDHELRLAPQGYGLGIYDIAFESCQVPGS